MPGPRKKPLTPSAGLPLSAKQHIEDLMYGRRKSFWLGPVLLLLSALYGLAVTLRHGLYRVHVFKTRRLPLRVISVGNIRLFSAGDTGGRGKATSLWYRTGV